MELDTLKLMLAGCVLTLVVISITSKFNQPLDETPLASQADANRPSAPSAKTNDESLGLKSGLLQRSNQPSIAATDQTIIPAVAQTIDDTKTISPVIDPEVVEPEVIETNNIEPEILATATQCTDNCLTALTEKLVSGVLIEGSDLQLASDHAQQLAKYLENNPDQLLSFEASLDTLQNPQDREVLLFVISKLSKEKRLESAQRLTNSFLPEDRIAGLSLLESSIGADTHFGHELTNLIYNETDEGVLIRAFKVIDELKPEEIDSETQSVLSDLADNGSTENIRSAALLAKINVVNSDEDIRSNVSDVLSGQSSNLKLVGLQALDKILARQKHKPEYGNWQQEVEFKDHVANIANDATAEPRLRIEALNLLSRHFKSNQ